MNADELVRHLAADCGQPQDVVSDILQALADTLEGELKAGRSVTIPGLGVYWTYRPLKGSRSILVQWTSDTGLRKRVVDALNAQAGREPIPQGQVQRARNGKGVRAVGVR